MKIKYITLIIFAIIMITTFIIANIYLHNMYHDNLKPSADFKPIIPNT
jgi:hypothetical protein